MKIIVDADACPKNVLEICLDIGRKYGVPVWTVASFNHQIDGAHHIVVGDASQETDLKIMNLTKKNDVVITQDWGLASVILSKGGHSLHPSGREYRPETIGFMLEEREMKAKFRRQGGRTKGPTKRKKEEDEAFGYSLDKLIREKQAGSGE